MVLDMTTTILAAQPQQTVTYLADITADGTSNGSFMTLVRIVVAAVSVVLVGGFALTIAKVQLSDGKGGQGAGVVDGKAKTKNMLDEAKNLALAEGLVLSAWGIVELAHNVFGGVFSGG